MLYGQPHTRAKRATMQLIFCSSNSTEMGHPAPPSF